ncbi:AAA family ATPase [Cryptosporangium sp. NPDC051539]|uniref:helix-turn-helix transcriptional regulator n=1 Tax=Cryptosporangium sp. NPDC051539 TaxID=3363962 RepID=UPI0037913659
MARDGRPTGAPAAGAGRWPFVGRASLLDDIDAALDNGRTMAVLLYGPSGVGKTRLGEEYADRAEAAGRPVARVSANRALAQIPLGALASLLASGGTDSLGGGTGRSAALDDFVTLFGYARTVVTALGRGHRLVLFIDDLPALDPLSVALIAQLVEVNAAALLATVPTGEAVPDALLGLWIRDRALRVDVPPLRRGECHALLTAVLGATVSASCVATLYQASGGSVLHLRELVLGAQMSGTLAQVLGVWQLVGSPTVTMALHDRLADRLRVVTDAGERAVLERLAVCRSLAVDEFPADADRDALARLDETGLVRLVKLGERLFAELSHPQYAEVVRAGLSQLRARSLLLEQAETADRRPHGAGDALRVAAWRLEATGTADPELLLRATRLARMAHDFPAVRRLAGAAAAHAETLDGGAQLLLLLGEALGELGHAEEALATLARAAELPASPPVAAQLAVVRAMLLSYQREQPDEALTVLRTARDALPDQDEVLAYTAAILFGDADQTAAALAELDRVGPRGGRSAGWAMAIVPALAIAGRTDEAVTVAADAVAAWRAGAQDSTWHGSDPLMAQALALSEDGRLDEAVASGRQALAQALDDGLDRSACAAATRLAGVYLLVGRARSAGRLYRDAVNGARAYGLAGIRQVGLCGLTVASAWTGDLTAARAAWAELPVATGPAGAWRVVGEAWLAAAEGDLSTAVELLETGGEDARRRGQLAVAAALWHDVVRLGRSRRVAERLADLAARGRSPLITVRADHAAAHAERDVARLTEVADAFERMGAVLFAAEAMAHASQAARADGSPRAATSLLTRTMALAKRCEGARTPGLLLADSVEPLTAREREVAMMAASGMPSRDIAERLVLSVRTVDNHLRSGYLKLGVSSRAELRSALRPVG